MDDYALVLNAGSSGVKFCVFARPPQAAWRLDALVFTAGIGENSAEIRRRICDACAWLGIELDAQANAKRGPRLSTAASRVSAWVVPTNEELMIARHTGRLLGLTGSRA
jgi:acetate kinase